MLRFKLLRYPVTIQNGAFVLAGIVLLFGLQYGSVRAPLTWIGIGFVSLMVHELGHAVTADLFRLGPIDIRLTQMGGLTRHRRPSKPWQMLLIALAGPGAGLALAAVALVVAIAMPDGLIQELAQDVVYLNLLWSVFNLLPLFPMDGGMATSSILQMITTTWAWPITWVLGFTLSIFMALWAFASGEIFIALFGALFASNNGQALWAWNKRRAPPATRAG